MKSLADTVSPQGVVVIARRPRAGNGDLWSATETPLVLVLDRLQDPGNVGTLLRSAEGAGVTAVAVLEGTADPFSPKALRSSMGSAFRLPVVTELNGREFLEQARTRGCAVLAADGGGAVSFRRTDWTRPTVLVVGNEGRGVAQDLLEACDQRVAIPMRGSVESLNVATAGAVLLFEAARQREGG